ncbi:calcium-dependent protein kinase 19-like protein, partial [Tanacetum coccineum]
DPPTDETRRKTTVTTPPDHHHIADTDRDGSISYNEFITAMMNIRREHKEEHLREAFNSFDKDGNG